MNKKIRIGLIVFVIILIPFFFIVKRLIAIEYQKQAINLFYFKSENLDSDYAEAIKKIDIAISLSPKNYLFYCTKAQMLFDYGYYQLALNAMKEIESYKNFYAEGYTYQGMLYDFMDKSDSALIQYNKALESYNIRIKKSTKNSLELESAEINRLFILLLLQDSSSAFIEYKRLIDIYPEDPVLESIRDFDKESYIRSLLTR